ncbi:MAG: class I SAM-dependent methyltransferase [Bacteroidota bacterium]|nr:class I SAM-dependent methyltransferase [Bacteroidota bacterium]
MNALSVLELPLYWEMANAEKIALLNILNEIRPTIAIEIGTKSGGSLQLLSAFCERVYSLDIDPAVTTLKSNFANVEFIIGDSKETLPQLLKDLSASNTQPQFILIDGDHSCEGVRCDIENILKISIAVPLIVFMHDSFNPECRRGMLEVNYESYNFVEMIDLDFVQGTYSPSEKTSGEMWGGFGLISLKPVPQKKVPLVKQSSIYAYRTTYLLSKHYHYNPASLKAKLKSFLFKKLLTS